MSTARQLLERTARLDFLTGVGIAIGRESIGLAHLVKRLTTVTVVNQRVSSLPPADRAEARRLAITEQVKSFLRDHAIESDRIFVSLPRSAALLARLSLPPATKSDLAQVVEFEIDRLLPLPKDDVYWDYAVRDLESKLDVQVMAIPRREVGEVLGPLEDSGVFVRSIVITPVALLDYLHYTAGDEDGPAVALYDDGGTAELDFVSSGQLLASHLVRPEEIRSEEAVAQLMKRETLSAGVSSEDTIQLYGFRDGGESESLLPAPILEAEADLVSRGRGSLLPEEGGPDVSAAAIPAIGAALGAVREGATALNLLPEDERRSGEEGAPVVTFLLAAVLVVVTLVWLVSAMMKDYNVSAQLQDELATLEPQIRAIHRNEDEARELHEQLDVLTRGDRRRISVFLRELTDLVPSDAYLTTFRVRAKKLELEGFAGSASDLIPLLEKSRHFKNVQFTSPVTKVQNNQERFALTTEIGDG